MVRQIGRGGATSAHGARAGRGESPVAGTSDEQRHNGGRGPIRENVSDDSARRAGRGGFAVRFSDRQNHLYAVWRLVRLVVRDCLGYAGREHILEETK